MPHWAIDDDDDDDDDYDDDDDGDDDTIAQSFYNFYKVVAENKY